MHPIQRAALRPPVRAVALLASAFALLFTPACSSGGASSDTVGRSTTIAGIVSFRDFQSGISFTLISETMLERAGVEGDTPDERTRNFSSTLRGDANTKVCRDDVVTGLTQYFDENGFSGWAIAGEAPVDTDASDKVIEVKIDGAPRHMLNPQGPDRDPNETVKFAEFVQVLVAAYSEVPQYQAVEGLTEFKRPELSESAKRALQGSGGSIFLDGSSRR